MDSNNENKKTDTINRSQGRLFLILVTAGTVLSFCILTAGVKGLISNLTPLPMPERSAYMDDQSYNRSLEIHRIGSSVKKTYTVIGIFFTLVGIGAVGLSVYGTVKILEKYGFMEDIKAKLVQNRTPGEHAAAYAKLLLVSALYIAGLGFNALGVWLLVIFTMRSPARVLKRIMLSLLLFPVILALLILFPFVWIGEISKTITAFCVKMESIYFPMVEG